MQYGLGIKAFALNLLVVQMVSLSRVQALVKNLITRAISQAILLKYILQLHEALAPWEEQAVARLLASPVMHVDETSMRVNKSRHWVHVCSAGDITLKHLHPGRGKMVELASTAPGKLRPLPLNALSTEGLLRQ